MFDRLLLHELIENTRQKICSTDHAGESALFFHEYTTKFVSHQAVEDGVKWLIDVHGDRIWCHGLGNCGPFTVWVCHHTDQVHFRNDADYVSLTVNHRQARDFIGDE